MASVKEKLARVRQKPSKPPDTPADTARAPLIADAANEGQTNAELLQPQPHPASRFLALRAKVVRDEESQDDQEQEISDPRHSEPSPALARGLFADTQTPGHAQDEQFSPAGAYTHELKLVLSLDDIPPGSAFSLEQWQQEERRCGIDNCAYEIHDENGHRLAHMPIVRRSMFEEDSADDLEARILSHGLLVSSPVHASLASKGESAGPTHTIFNYRQKTGSKLVTYMVTRPKTALARKSTNWAIWNHFPMDEGSSEAQRSAISKKDSPKNAWQSNQASKPSSGFSGSSRFTQANRNKPSNARA